MAFTAAELFLVTEVTEITLTTTNQRLITLLSGHAHLSLFSRTLGKLLFLLLRVFVPSLLLTPQACGE
jgi:hypothetical protein